TATVSLQAGTSATVVASTPTLNVSTSSAGTTLSVTNSGNISVTAPVTATDVLLQTNSNGSVAFNADVTGSNSVAVNANGGDHSLNVTIAPDVTVSTTGTISFNLPNAPGSITVNVDPTTGSGSNDGSLSASTAIFNGGSNPVVAYLD